MAPRACAEPSASRSARKYSGCVLADGRSLVMGAAQFVFSNGVPDSVSKALSQAGERARTLVVAECDGFDKDGSLIGLARPLGILSLSDHIQLERARDDCVLRRPGRHAQRDLRR